MGWIAERGIRMVVMIDAHGREDCVLADSMQAEGGRAANIN
jgi:hypothetical protein